MQFNRIPIINRYQEQARLCRRCHDLDLLYQNDDGKRAYPLFHEGARCDAGIIAVLEAPNFADSFDPDKGHLTVEEQTDPTGKFVHELIRHVGLTTDDVLFTNAVLCLPASKGDKFPVTAALKEQCRPWLERLIIDLQIEVVLTLGGKALEAVGRIEKHGLTLKAGAGKLHEWYNRKLLPLYHPGLLGRISRRKEQQLVDIEALSFL